MIVDPVEKLLWIDMEMSGLDVDKEVIIEVACIVTDLNFKEYDVFETVVKQPQKYIDNMDAWNKEHHTKSGLVKKIPNGMDPEMVEQKIIDLVHKHWPKSVTNPKLRPIIAGNSIAQDRLFIDRYFKNLSPKLHYRLLDVSSFKTIMNHKFRIEHNKKNAHRALDDIRESIEELRYYMQFIKTPQS